jgi:Domain of unknown function (DUF5615)
MLSLYMDQHVHKQIALGLRRRGLDVLTAHADGRANAPDDLLLARATDLSRVFFSQDEDLLVIARGFQQQGIYFRGLIFAHQLRITIGTCIDDLELICRACDPE